jgi:hypothetical protein
MTPARALSSRVLLLAVVAAAACASSVSPLQLSDRWPSQAGDYRDVTRKWTRHGRQRSMPDNHGNIFDQTIDVVATFKSPEWRAAYVKYRAEHNKLPPGEVNALTAREKAEAQKNYEVMLMVATYDPRLNELHKGERSVWRVALVDAGGAEIVASEIKRDRRPRSEIQADFPQLGDFHEPYVARFPRTVDLLRPDAGRFSLKVTSSQAGVELVWAEPGARARAAR